MKFKILILLVLVSFLSCSKEKRSNKAAEKMQEFVVNISNYAKQFNSNFIIIPQNGIELCYNNIEKTEGLNSQFMNAINGIGVEELFYNGSYSVDNYRLEILQELKSSKKILVSEYVSNNNNAADAISKNTNEGFLCFVRENQNYNYLQIPDNITNENSNNITDLSLAQNYLYLISSDNYNSKQEMINAISTTNFDVIIIDLFFNNSEFTSDEINKLKTKANGAKRLVISYINVGAAENYRYYWKNDWKLHKPNWLKKKYDGYDDEIWVKFWDKDWQNVIYGNNNSYMKKIIDANFDGAYLDNVEAYYFLYFND
jgi:cysteinyl-tRNA synthetase